MSCVHLCRKVAGLYQLAEGFDLFGGVGEDGKEAPRKPAAAFANSPKLGKLNAETAEVGNAHDGIDGSLHQIVRRGLHANHLRPWVQPSFHCPLILRWSSRNCA